MRKIQIFSYDASDNPIFLLTHKLFDEIFEYTVIFKMNHWNEYKYIFHNTKLLFATFILRYYLK